MFMHKLCHLRVFSRVGKSKSTKPLVKRNANANIKASKSKRMLGVSPEPLAPDSKPVQRRVHRASKKGRAIKSAAVDVKTKDRARRDQDQIHISKTIRSFLGLPEGGDMTIAHANVTPRSDATASQTPLVNEASDQVFQKPTSISHSSSCMINTPRHAQPTQPHDISIERPSHNQPQYRQRVLSFKHVQGDRLARDNNSGARKSALQSECSNTDAAPALPSSHCSRKPANRPYGAQDHRGGEKSAHIGYVLSRSF